VKRVLREPLLHFLVLGVGLFVLHRGLRPEESRGPLGKPRITVSAGVTQNLAHTFEATWQRPPALEELTHLIDDYVDEELSYRRALELGLEQDDAVVRRRLRQKLELLVETQSGTVEPSEAELCAFFDAQRERYREKETFSFRQVYVGAGETEELKARAALLVDVLENGGDATALAAPTGLPLENEALSSADVIREFGEVFAAALAQLPVGRWSGPVESGFGQHVVLLQTKEAGRVPELDDVRDEVRRDLDAERAKHAITTYLATERARYDVVVEPVRDGATANAKTASAGTSR
jgi:hypothetical protein